jgi:zinc transporter
MNKHILFSYTFDQHGKARKLSSKEVSQELRNEDDLAWVHLDANHKSTKEWLEREVNYLDHLIIDALIAEEARPRMIEFDTGLLLILRGINLGKNSNSEDISSIRIWIDAQRIITLQRHEMVAVFDVRDQIDEGKAIRTSGEFLYNLLYQILHVTSPFLYALAERLDELEEKITITHDMKFREELLKIRRRSTIFKRYLKPQEEVVAKLRLVDQIWINDWAKRHFQENLDHIAHMIEEVEEVRDRSQILHDELAHSLTEKLNKSMHKLSIIASVFMPITFFTSVFSMNVGGIPGIGDQDAFDLIMISIVLITLLQMWFFKKKDLL